MAGPSGATTRLALPYPIPNDTVDVPRDVKALADKLDVQPGIALPLERVGSTPPWPASPVPGEMVAYVPTGDIVWMFRYSDIGTSPHRWQFVGGTPYYLSVSGTVGQPGGGAWAQASPAMRLTLPLFGEYDMTLWSVVSTLGTAAPTAAIGLKINGSAGDWTPGAEAVARESIPANSYANLSERVALTTTAKSQIVDVVANLPASCSLQARALHIVPTRVTAPA